MDIQPSSALDKLPRDTIFTVGLVLPHERPQAILLDQMRAALMEAVRLKLPRAATRVVRGKTGYELHVPQDLSDDASLVGFTGTLHLDQPLPQHVVPAKADIKRPLISCDPDASNFFRGPSCPSKIRPFLKNDSPALHAHVGIYKDAVVIGMTAVHVAFDGEGISIVLRAWAAATRHELDSIIESPRTFLPVQTEEIMSQASALGHKDPFDSRRDRGIVLLGLWSTIAFILAYIWNLITIGKRLTVLIRLPKEWVHEQKELANAGQTNYTAATERISSNDIILAFILQLAYASRQDSQPQKVLATINTRETVPSVFKADKQYIHNAVLHYGTPPLPATFYASESLGTIAGQLRRSLIEYRRSSPLAELAYFCKHTDERRLFIPAAPGQGCSFHSSWLRSELSSIEFSLSLTNGQGQSRVRPSYVTGYIYNQPPNFSLIFSEDEAAYYATWHSKKATIIRNAAILQKRYGLQTALE